MDSLTQRLEPPIMGQGLGADEEEAAPQAEEAGKAKGDCSPVAGAAGGAYGDGGPPPPQPQLGAEAAERVRRAIEARAAALAAADPGLPAAPLARLNAAGAAALKAGDALGAAAAYALLFRRAAAANVTHPEMHVCHGNAAAAAGALGLHDDALRHAERARVLAAAAARRGPRAAAAYVKAVARKGDALAGLGRHREAAAAYEEGLKADPFDARLATGLRTAQRGVLADLAAGRGGEARALPAPPRVGRVAYHPYDAPLHRVRAGDALPGRLLTPFQAENDAAIKDTYAYLTIQADVRMPRRALRALADRRWTRAWRAALAAAVADVAASGADARVLLLGGGAGGAAAAALAAGARHVTAAERWLYLALAAKQTLEAVPGLDPGRWRVVYKRPTDLALGDDVPVAANVVALDCLDEGLLTGGLVPAARHALGGLALPGARVLPAAATVFVQAVELRTARVAAEGGGGRGLDMSAADLYRWHPAYAAGAPLDASRVRRLSRPAEAFHFDLGAPPEAAAARAVDLEFVAGGRWNAVLVWYRLRLHGDVHVDTDFRGAECSGFGGCGGGGGGGCGGGGGGEEDGDADGPQFLGPCLQYLAGELRVERGAVLPLQCAHNTARLRFDVAAPDWVHLYKPDAGFSPAHYDMLADGRRLAAYGRALRRAVRAAKAPGAAGGGAHVLDAGCGAGALALLAARAGADSVVAADIAAPACDAARRAAAANAAAGGGRVAVVHADASALQRGRDVRALGVNVIVADVFDAGLLGDGAAPLLEAARRRVGAPGAAVIPAAATLWAVGVEALTPPDGGADMAALDAYRWAPTYEAVRLAETPHRRLTAPARVGAVRFDGAGGAGFRGGPLRLEAIAAGTLNAVAFWFDLHLDDAETVTSGPAGVAPGGAIVPGGGVWGVEGGGAGGAGGAASGSAAAAAAREAYAAAAAAAGAAATPADEHHWGQALQYLDRWQDVAPGRRVTLLARREGGAPRFEARAGAGGWAPRPPWRAEWGGGASVENPHVQRLLYCELLVKDFAQRCRSRRFPSVERDTRLALQHAGSLFLDVATIQEATRELVALERLAGGSPPEVGPGAVLEALSRPPLRLR